MTLPVNVMGADCHKRQWREVAATLNVSSGGMALRLSTRVMIGDMLFVELALPARLQNNPDPSVTYKSYGLVRYIQMQGNQQIVRLQFVQQQSPGTSQTYRLQYS